MTAAMVAQNMPQYGMAFDYAAGHFAKREPAIASWAAPVPAPAEEEAQPCRGQRGFFAGRESVRSRARGKAVQTPAPVAAAFVPPQRARTEVTPSEHNKKLELDKVAEAADVSVEVCQDSDGEEVFMCPMCRLPMGDRVCRSKEGSGAPMHGECMAQFALLRMKADEDKRQREDAALKAARHSEHGLGWSAAMVPRASNLAARLDGFVPRGMVCVVLQDDNSVSLAPTCDPAAAVNLEYLMLALQVKRTTGTEARFSLDPSKTSGMQVRRYVPAWLAGTSAGEVMFQADYYLKELSMGEHEQPVVGMRSCFDIAVEEGMDKRWQGREWFVIRKADMQLSEDNVLVPTVKMGIEAREQVNSHGNGLHDAAITRPDHPLAKYAESFARNFDLIAERKGAVYHLREYAKASTVAKFLLEANVAINDSWFNLADEVVAASPEEVPCLWSERGYKTIRMKDGRLVDAQDLDGPMRIGVYGGVDFVSGLGPPAPAQWATATAVMMGYQAPPGGAAAAVAAAPGAVAAAVPGAGAARAVRSRRQALKMRATRRGPRVIEGPGLPQGVDLNLDSFDLDAGYVAGRNFKAPEGCAPMGKAFWSEIAAAGDAKSALKEDDKKLLRSIFNPSLTDRIDEGDRFAPPDASPSYVEKLRALVCAEDAIRQERRQHFLSADFSAAKPGPLFPTWASRFELARDDEAAEPQGALEPRPDYKPSRESLRSTKVAFDKATEDGTRFRIYRPGSVEVRTIQEAGGEETVAMVFAVSAPARTSPRSGKVEDSETIAKVTTYVESETVLGKTGRHYYTVLKTSRGNLVVTEQRRNGLVSWEENPQGLEVRNSLAKVVYSAHLSGGRTTLRDVKGQQVAASGEGKTGATTASRCKRYALDVFRRAGGAPGKPLEGFKVLRQGKTAKIL